MNQRNIFKQFKKLFPQYVGSIYQWHFINSNCIWILTDCDEYFVFTYDNESNWRFETAVSYIYNGRRI